MGIQAFLATSFVHFYPPKHHKQASTIIDQVLACSPSNIPCLMGHAFVQQAALNWKDAGATFDLVFSIIPDDVNLGLRAREEGAWCKVQINLCEVGLVDLQQVSDALNGFDDDKRNSDRARCLWRIGKCYMLLTGPSV
jgi:superkiller protein 3